jgi:dienelactone hydrolase
VSYWTKRRFAPEVIEATGLAVDDLKRKFGASKLVLVGYSGGGAVAALVAARRQDVTQLVTVAGNLDHNVWTSIHHIPRLEGSLNPADAWEHLQNIPQIHFLGADDKNVSKAVVDSYLDRFQGNIRPMLIVVDGFDHICCWVEQWSRLSRDIFR